MNKNGRDEENRRITMGNIYTTSGVPIPGFAVSGSAALPRFVTSERSELRRLQ